MAHTEGGLICRSQNVGNPLAAQLPIYQVPGLSVI